VPLAEVFGDVPHQLCTFHVVAEVCKAVLGAVASARKGLAANNPNYAKGAEHASSQAGGPHEKAAGRARRRVVHLAVSVRPTSPE